MLPFRIRHPRVGTLARAGVVLLAFAAGLALPGPGPAPPRPARPRPPPGDAELIRLAVREAHANCGAKPPYRLDAALRAFGTDRLEGNAYGELEALRDEARWLASLEAGSDLGERSPEDVRFLLGAIHDYLGRSLRPFEQEPRWVHVLAPDRYDQLALRAFRGLDFGDLLGLWD